MGSALCIAVHFRLMQHARGWTRLKWGVLRCWIVVAVAFDRLVANQTAAHEQGTVEDADQSKCGVTKEDG